MYQLLKKSILISALFLTDIALSIAGPVEFYFLRQQATKIHSLIPYATSENIFTQFIDHNDHSVGTFPQRYFIDESYGPEADSPVFFYICGEWTCSKRDLDGAIRSYAKKHHAKLIALEHRYYGKSLPFKTLSAHDLRYLTTDAALEDLAYFQESIRAEKNWTGTWIAFGGSYPGSLSAYYRLKYPNLVAGSLASSAPVMAKEDFYEYDEHMAKVAGPKCTSHMQEVVNEIEYSLNHNKTRFKEIKELFAASEVNHPVDFLYLVADIGASAVQYGKKDIFCNQLANSKTPLEGYAQFAKALYEEMGSTAVQLTVQGLMSEDPKDHTKGNSAGYRQWYYQSCIEYGYWQNANLDRANSTRSSLINIDYHHQACNRLFNLKNPANTAYINSHYYYPLIEEQVSNIYFTNGEQDPWSKLSLMKKNGNDTNKNLTYRLITGSAHCNDLHEPSDDDSKSLKNARRVMNELLSTWLKKS